MIPATSGELFQTLKDCGLSCKLSKHYVNVQIGGTAFGWMIGARPRDNAIAIATAWPVDLDEVQGRLVEQLLPAINRHLPSGAWRLGSERRLGYMAKIPWGRSRASSKVYLRHAFQAQERILRECTQYIGQCLASGAVKPVRDEFLGWCQPQVEALPTHDRVSDSDWAAVERGILGCEPAGDQPAVGEP